MMVSRQTLEAKLDNEGPGLIYFLIDADGCVFHKGVTHYQKKDESGEKYLSAQDVTDGNPALFKHMQTVMKDNPNAEIRIGIGSSRQSGCSDQTLSFQEYMLPTFRNVILRIAEVLQRMTRRNISVDHYLLCYSFHSIPEGTLLNQIKFQQDCFKDEHKLLIHYAFSHRAASYAKSKKLGKTAIYFYDDLDVMLEAPGKFFDKKTGFLSSQVEIHPYHYACGKIGQPKPIVRGSGPIDLDYHKGVKELCTLAGIPEEFWHKSKDNRKPWDVSSRLLAKAESLPINLIDVREPHLSRKQVRTAFNAYMAKKDRDIGRFLRWGIFTSQESLDAMKALVDKKIDDYKRHEIAIEYLWNHDEKAFAAALRPVVLG